MGILDDAIREHLELKRQHGADREDVERLEQEAFGPVARPGDPEFDTGTETAAPAATEQPAAEAPVAEPPAADEAAAPAAEDAQGGFTDWFSGEAETTVAPAAEVASEAPPATPAEQARIEHAELGETADHPAPTQLGPEDEAEPVPEEGSPSSEEQPPVEEPVAEAPAAEPAADETPPEAPESGIFDGGETDFEDDPGAGAEGGVTPAPTTDHDLPPAPVERPAEEGAEDEEGEEGDDLLEETPDFLQDAPEGEDLWFEQGPPKDFDFDED
jgi:hypothetical protein